MIDITFDFRSDAKGKDPDTYSPTLNAYHRALWSKELPNGEVMELESKGAPYVLTWKDFYFTSDTIIVEMRSLKNMKIIEQARQLVADFEEYYEHFLSRSYSIGSMVIFPVHTNSMNQRRGMNTLISDRWDLTLECIRRHYAGEESPLSKVIEGDKAFYDLFIDFKGYVDFFLLQDCVSEDYSFVNIWMGDASFRKSGLRILWKIISTSSLKNISSWIRGIEGYRIFAKRKNGLESSNVILEVADDLCHGC